MSDDRRERTEHVWPDAMSVKRMNDILAIDFEASCLPRHGRSYPIEVGIADQSGVVRSWLIRPIAEWRDWTWTGEAQALHGITYERLLREGLPVSAVAAELKDIVRGRRLIADSYLDDYWMRTLMAAAGCVRPDLSVEHIDALIDQLNLSADQVKACIAHTDHQAIARHRAGDDARWLAVLIAGLLERGGRSASSAPVVRRLLVPRFDARVAAS